MAESEQTLNSNIPDNWVDVPTFYVDGVLGASRARGVQRILMGSVTFNTDTQAEMPTYKPVCELVMTLEGVQDFIEYLESLIELPDNAA